MPLIVCYQKSANQNENEIPAHLLEWPKSRMLTIGNAERGGRYRNSLSLLAGKENGTAALEAGLAVSFITKQIFPQDPSVVLLGIYPNALNTYVHIKTCTQIFIAALFIIVKTWKQPQCSSVSKWINTLCYIQTIKQYLFLRHERILNACQEVKKASLKKLHTVYSYMSFWKRQKNRQKISGCQGGMAYTKSRGFLVQ